MQKADGSTSPSRLLRARRPEQFSDSVDADEHELSADYLSFVLDNLTVARRENAFENFARLLCQREICPNILPQTGPVGGGDSKTDGSTYPVSQAIANTWPWYQARLAASEYWVFAFSAKEDWRAKAKDDVAKIASLPKRPDKVFFVTNQAVKDKSRAEVIGQVRTSTGLELAILDRTWIVERTLKGGHFDLVTDALNVQTSRGKQRVLGPLDSKRQAELADLERRLSVPAATSVPTAMLVEEYLHGARLSRGVNAPKFRTMGFLENARRAAEANGSEALVIDALYQSAWTLFWWYDDTEAAWELYDVMESRVLPTAEPRHYELLGNIWLNLYGALVHNKAEEGKMEAHRQRRAKWIACLQRIEADNDRPNAAASAKILRLTSELADAARDPGQLKAVLIDLGVCLQAAADSAFVPVAHVFDLIEEFGEFVPQLKEYDDLLDQVCSLRAKRESEQAAAATLLNRGLQLLDADQDQKALGYLIRAREKLVRHESLDVLCRALTATALIYERLGLRWAARLELVRALFIETHDVRLEGKGSRLAAFLAHRLARLDLELGHVTSALEWRKLALVLAGSVGARDPEKEAFDDLLIAIAVLHSAPTDVPFLGRLVKTLAEQGLDTCQAAVLFLLGHVVESGQKLPDAFKQDGPETTFQKMSDQPATGQMMLPPVYGITSPVAWTLDIRPVNVRLTVDSHPTALTAAEHLSGLIEIISQFVDTRGSLPLRSGFAIRVRCSETADERPRIAISDAEPGEFDLDFAVKPGIYDRPSAEAQEEEKRWLGEAAVAAVTSVTRLHDGAIEQLASGGVLGQVFGYPASARSIRALFPLTRYSLGSEEFANDPSVPKYVRDVPWSPAQKRTTDMEREYRPGIASVFDPVRVDLWNRAKWAAMAFMYAAAASPPPVLLFVFRSGAAGVAAFKHLRSSVNGDPARVRVSVVTDTRAGRYAVQISGEPNIAELGPEDGEKFVSISRLHGFRSSAGLPNVTAFKAAQSRSGMCVIVPGELHGNGGFKPLNEGAIAHVKVRFRERSEVVGPNDLDHMAAELLDSDDF